MSRWPHNPPGWKDDNRCYWCNGDGRYMGSADPCWCIGGTYPQPRPFREAIEARAHKPVPSTEPTGKAVERRDTYPHTWDDVQELIDDDRRHGILI